MLPLGWRVPVPEGGIALLARFPACEGRKGEGRGGRLARAWGRRRAFLEEVTFVLRWKPAQGPVGGGVGNVWVAGGRQCLVIHFVPPVKASL